MRICILGSGSSGNATLIVAGETRVLVDCGMSARELIRRIQSVGEDPTRLTAVVITHEHSDHARGLAVLSKILDVSSTFQPQRSTPAISARKSGW